MTATRSARAKQQRAELLRAHARRRRIRLAVGSVVGIVVLLGVVIAFGLASTTSRATAPSPAGQGLLAAVTGVPSSTLEAVSGGGTGQSIVGLSSTVAAGGKPRVLYIGAEYCPYCAAQRWPVVQALSRFGTWTGLTTTTSATDDVFPGTATFSFHGATYSSDYLQFEGVETQGNVRVGGSYPQLQSLTAEQRRILASYDAPPYFPASAAGGIPFVDYGGRYATSGSGYSPDVLAGKSASQVAEALKDPATSQAKAVLGTANRLTAALCQLTGGQPGKVCQAPQVMTLAKQLPRGR